MADDSGSSNKVTIELDLETKDFKLKLGEAEGALKSTGESGGKSFAGLGMQALFLNEAIELGKKAMEGFEYILSKAGAAEGIKNQKTAFKNLSAQLGIDANNLTLAISKASEGTLSNLESMQAGFKLLSSKIRAENIPALVEFAHKMEITRQIPFEQTIQSISMALETGTTRGLKQYGIEIERTGNRQEILNLILSQAKARIESLGGGYEESAAKIEAKVKNSTASIKKYFGELFVDTATMFAGDDVDKYGMHLRALEKQMQIIVDKVKSGATVADLNDTKGFVPIAEARSKLEKQIEETKKKISDLNHKEKDETEEINKKISQKNELLSVVSASDKKSVEIREQVKLYDELNRKEIESGEISNQVTAGLYQTKKVKIEEDYRRQIEVAGSVPQTTAQYAAKVIEIERQKYEALQKLRISDEDYAKVRQNAELKAIESNDHLIENAAQKHQDILIQKENSSYKADQDRARNTITDKAQLQLKLEQMETTHQKELAKIQDSYSAVSVKNFTLGWQGGLAQLKKENTNFAQITQKMTVQTNGIMTKSFVAAAKGQGNAMEMMKQQFLEMIGTQLIQTGSYHLLAGIFPPNPVELGQGAAMIAAGSAIVGAAGGASSGASGGGGSGGDGGYSPGQASQKELERKSAQIIIQGDYMNSRETQTHLAEVLRSNSDITDYAIVAQGKHY
ncbi:MAG: hypothetical protein IPQ08_06220 [Chitinophagaceae bacterium]|nr:hypothetical protein [Chitinophagaceae bacterium]